MADRSGWQSPQDNRQPLLRFSGPTPYAPFVTDTLGIQVSGDGIAAAVGSDDPSSSPVLVMLGADGPVAAAAVAAGPDGSVVIGDAAVGAEGPVVTDPLERAGRGRTGALTAVFGHVLGQAAVVAEDGRAPSRLAVVVPDDFDAAARDRVVEAANGVGIRDVTLVPRSLASARGRGDDSAGLAIAAVLIAAVEAPPPIVTREDLGEVVPPSAPVPPRTPTDTGPVSVFDEPEQPTSSPARKAPAPVAAQPPRPAPVAPQPAPSSIVSPPPLRPVPPRNLPLGAIGGVVAVIIVLLIGVAVFGGDDPVETVGSTTTAPATTEAPAAASTTTTPTPSTTVAPSTTSSSTTSSTTTSSSTTTTSTTTVPVRVGTPGPVTLLESGLQFDTGVVARFGDPSTDVLAAIRAVLGDPDSDSGRSANDFCDGSIVRFVRWGNLELVFTGDEGPIGEVGDGDGEGVGDDAESPAPLTFTQWFADGHRTPTGLVTPEGVGESGTVGLLEVTYGSALQLVAAFEDDIVGVFAVTNPQTGAVLNGTTLGLDPDGVVTTLWAGDSCARLFT